MNVKDNIKLFKTLGEETRYKIVELLLKGEKCACEIHKLIDRTQSNTSMHLSKLTDTGILKSRRNGKMIIYSIADLKVCDLFKALGYSKGKILSPCCCMDKESRGNKK